MHPADDIRALDLLYGHGDQAVVQQDGAALLHIPIQLLIRDAAARLIAGLIGDPQGEELPFFQLDFAAGKGLQADLRPLGIQQGSHRQAQFLPYCVEAVEPLLLLFVGAVGKIEACHIHAGLHHLAEHRRVVAGRAQGAHDLGLSHSHIPSF